MPRLRMVEVYPLHTWWGHPWVDGDVDGDAFARVARGICDAYSTHLSSEDLQHTVSSLVIYIDSHRRVVPAGGDESQTVVLPPNGIERVFEGFEQAAVRVGTGFAELNVDEQRRIALEAVHAAAEGLARLRGLDLGAFERARAAVVEAGYVFRWVSDWKSSPGRRWRARCCFRTEVDGYGRLTVEVSTADNTVSATTAEQMAATTAGDFIHAAKSLRWVGPDRLEVMPWSDSLIYRGGVFAISVAAPSSTELRLTELEVIGPPSDLSHEDQLSFVESRAAAAKDRHRESSEPASLMPVLLLIPDPKAREIVTVRGASTNLVPEKYGRTLHALFEQLQAPQWQRWWAPADLPKLEISWRAEPGGHNRLVVRRSKNKLTAQIERTGFGLAGSDPVQAAREDLAGLMIKVQHRMGLSAPPPLH